MGDFVNPMWLYGLYATLAAGAAGLALCLPGPEGRTRGTRMRQAGALIAMASLAAVVVYCFRWIGPRFDGRTFFVVFAAIAIAASVRVVTHTRAVYSALYFVLVVLAVTGLCVLAAADFLAAALVIVYGGAILVTYVFVIMLAQQSGPASYDHHSREPIAAAALGFALVAAVTQAMVSPDPIATNAAGRSARWIHAVADEREARPAATEAGADDGIAMINPRAVNGPQGNVRAVGTTLITQYVMAVELAGVLLLVAVVGAITIARKRIEPEALTPEERTMFQREPQDPRQRGREAAPF